MAPAARLREPRWLNGHGISSRVLTFPRWLWHGPRWWRSLNAWWLIWWGWRSLTIRARGDATVAEAKRHRHEFTMLWWRFGPYGPYGHQRIHVHGCRTEGCDRVLIGAGRDCDGKAGSHHRETLREATDG